MKTDDQLRTRDLLCLQLLPGNYQHAIVDLLRRSTIESLMWTLPGPSPLQAFQIKPLAKPRHQVHLLVEYGKDERGGVCSLKRERVVVFAAGELQLRPVFENHARVGFALTDGDEVIFERGFVAVSLFDAPFLDRVERDVQQVELGSWGELVIRHLGFCSLLRGLA